MNKLYIVATPIGNLGDISQRALKVLKEVDFILCEDTRQTKKLLNHFEISKPTISYHQHSKLNKVNYILDLLKQDKDLALVSDAGTPGISDPGNKLIKEVVDNLKDKIKIIPIPGPCAVITALSISGFPTDKFIFLGFPPHKKKRKKFFEEVGKAKNTVVLYESKHRIIKTLSELPGDAQIVVARELTKKFETIYRGTAEEVLKQLQNAEGTVSDEVKGEFVIVISK